MLIFLNCSANLVGCLPVAVADAADHTILCWETMEHFNFNPVKFVRELHRVLKPGARGASMTVPNNAFWQHIFTLLSGRGEKA